MNRTRRRASLRIAMAVSLIVAQAAVADSSPTQSQVPSDGGAVKSGDVIIWKVNKKITLQAPAETTAAAKPAPGAGPTPGDAAAAAAAVKTSADKLLQNLGSPPEAAPAADMAKYKAATAADDQATTAATKANSDAFTAGASNKFTASGVQQALAKAVSDARQNNDALIKAALAAANQASTDAQSAAAAVAKAAQAGATPGDREAATKASMRAAQSQAASQSAQAQAAAADAYLAAATDALAAAVTTPPANAAASPSTTANDGTVCFPSNSLFQVTSVVAASTSPANSNAAAGQSEQTVTSNTQRVSGYFSSKSGVSQFHIWHRNSLPFSRHVPGGKAPESMQSPCGDGYPYASYDVTYDFTADQLSKQDFSRGGFTWGGLIVPYKFYFTDHSLKSNSSTVGFVGYEGWFPGVSLSTVAAVGPGMAPSSTSASSSSPGSTPATGNQSSTLVTYTAAIGFILAFGDSKTVKAGLLFGRDYQGKGSNFQYENKTWMALSVGAGF